ncbi:MAG TPA: TlyA family RNA methyltransferase [Candidatus Saccharimonadales bacterium]|nr:TlyA family RNA methyltransferase [Candidatus Saccharimonadales bacterium]
MKIRLDRALVERGLVPTRSQAESYIKLSDVRVNNTVITKPGFLVSSEDDLKLDVKEQYVSRAGLKLASVAEKLGLSFKDKVVLDVGSSTGGFTDFALRHGATKVVAVDVGSNQLHPSLRANERVELYEQTDIRNFAKQKQNTFDLVLIDLSFVSLRDILPNLVPVIGEQTKVVAMVKPQFEAGKTEVNKGIIKNDKIRRNILKDFENWIQNLYVILDKADSEVAGAKGNRERFYLLRKA